MEAEATHMLVGLETARGSVGFLAASEVWRLGPSVCTASVLSKDGCTVLERREEEQRIRERAYAI